MLILLNMPLACHEQVRQSPLQWAKFGWAQRRSCHASLCTRLFSNLYARYTSSVTSTLFPLTVRYQDAFSSLLSIKKALLSVRRRMEGLDVRLPAQCETAQWTSFSIRLQQHFRCWLQVFSWRLLCAEAVLIRNHHSAALHKHDQGIVCCGKKEGARHGRKLRFCSS